MTYGSALASFWVEEFGSERGQRLTREEIDERYEAFRRMSEHRGRHHRVRRAARGRPSLTFSAYGPLRVTDVRNCTLERQPAATCG